MRFPDPYATLRARLLLAPNWCPCCCIPPEVDYEPGALSIICRRCLLSFAAPDSETGTVEEGWRRRVNLYTIKR